MSKLNDLLEELDELLDEATGEKVRRKKEAPKSKRRGPAPDAKRPRPYRSAEKRKLAAAKGRVDKSTRELMTHSAARHSGKGEKEFGKVVYADTPKGRQDARKDARKHQGGKTKYVPGGAEHDVKGQSNEFYKGKGPNDPKGDVTAVSDQGAPYMSRCMCYGGKRKRLKIVNISCSYKKAYNKRYKKMNPHSGWKPVT